MAVGDITAAVDSLIWNALAVEKPRAIHVSGDVYAFSYEEYDNKGKVSTVEIDADGNIGAAVIDTIKFEDIDTEQPDIIKISGNVFAVVYQNDDVDGFIHTMTINDDGSIDDTLLDSFEFDGTNCRYPRIIHVAGTTYAIAYSYNYDGKVATVTIDDAGEITEPIIDSLVYDATSCFHSEILKVADNTFAIFYNKLNGPGMVITLTISDVGAITVTPIDSEEIAGGVLSNCCACHVASNTYAFAYAKTDWFGYVSTIEIDGIGGIGPTIDTLKFEEAVSNTLEPDILRISDTIVCVTYSGVGEDGFMRTIEIDAEGEITDTVMSTLEFDTVRCLRPSLIHISGNTYAVFYGGDGFYGTIKTPQIVSAPPDVPKHLMIMGLG